MNKLTKIAGAIVLALSVNFSHAALTIVGTAANGYNFALSDGSVLTDGAVFKIGYYDSAYAGSYFSGLTTASAFETGWTTLAQSTANESGYSGLRSASIVLATGVDTYVGKSLIMLVGNAATIAASTQIGVFSNSAWAVPLNPTGVLPADFGFDIQEDGTVAKFGLLSLGTGAFPSDGVPNSANLAVVIPEPSSASLLALGMAGLVALRARRKS